jgi:cytochrome c1
MSGRTLIVAVMTMGAVAAALASCHSSPSRESPPQVPEGDPAAGADLIARFGCGSCHTIPGIPEADGQVGPPLAGFAGRQVIAGQLPNNAENLIAWIVDPPSIEPGTAMPNLNVTEEQARDIAAYLFTLE